MGDSKKKKRKKKREKKKKGKKTSSQKWTIQLDVNLSQSFKPMAAFKINTVNQSSVLINTKSFNIML